MPLFQLTLKVELGTLRLQDLINQYGSKHRKVVAYSPRLNKHIAELQRRTQG